MGDARTPGHPVARTTRWLAPVLVLVVWQVAAQAGWLPTRILPAPSSVAAAAATLARSGELWQHSRISILGAVSGLLLGGAAGVTLGVLNGIARRAATPVHGLLQALGLVPVLALAPLVLLWFGVGETARLALLSLGAFFPVYRQTVRGIREVDPALIETGRAHGLHGWPLYRDVILPGALPCILAGVRQGLGLVWLILVALELFLAPSGLGLLAMRAREALRTDVLLLGIVLYAVLSVASDALIHAAQRRLLRWSPAYRPELFSGTN